MVDDEPVTDSSSAPKLRGLWAVMAPSPSAEAASAESAVEQLAGDDAAKPRGLWGVMGAAAAVDEPAAVSTVAPTEVVTTNVTAAVPIAAPTVSVPRAGWTGDWIALVAGGLAVPLSALAMREGIAAALPAGGLAFVAVLCAALAASVPKCSAAVRGRAMIGGGLGAIALLLGPFVFAPWGNALRREESAKKPRSPVQQTEPASPRERAKSAD